MERIISLKRAIELIEKEDGIKVSKGKVTSYEKRMNAALMFYELTVKDKNVKVKDEAEEVYIKLYKLYKEKNRLIMNLGKEKKDIQYLKSEDFEEDLLQLATEFGIEEEYSDFVKVEKYLKKQRNIYIENGITEYYPLVDLTIDLISKNSLIKEKAKDKEIKSVIDEETGVTIEKKIIELLKTDHKTIYVNKDTPRVDFLFSLKGLRPKKAVVYSLRLTRYQILKEDEVYFRDSFFNRLSKSEIAIDIIIQRVERLKELKGKKLFSILKILVSEDSMLEYEILAKYEEVRAAFNETYEKFKAKFPWMLKLYTDEEELRLVYIYFLIYKKDFNYSPSKKVQYKYLLKKLVNNKKVTQKEREFVLQDFFLIVLLYLDQDLESVMTYIMNKSHEFILSYLNLVLEGIEKWDLYEEQFGKRKLTKYKVRKKINKNKDKKLSEKLSDKQKENIVKEIENIREMAGENEDEKEITKKISEKINEMVREYEYEDEYEDENLLMLIVMKSMLKEEFELDKNLFQKEPVKVLFLISRNKEILSVIRK